MIRSPVCDLRPSAESTTFRCLFAIGIVLLCPVEVSMGVVKDVWDIGGQVLQSARKRRERGNVEKVLSVMTERKNWKRTDLAKLANISEDDTLQALRVLEDSDKVIPLDVDEEPKGTFWRRI
jgi:hypothetical protein